MGEKAAPEIVYITSRGHSGSTLLDLLISGHAEVASVGEIKWLGRDHGVRCTCGVAPFLDCPFWRAVDRRLRGTDGSGLVDLEIASDDEKRFARDNRRLFAAVAAESGARLVVDSSKSLARLEPLLAAETLRVRVVHLVRSPFGVAYSNLKRGRDWRRHARKYGRALARTEHLLRDRPNRVVRYEDLASDPATTLSRLMRWLDLELEPGQLELSGRERHNVGGNEMRFANVGEIRLDDAWRRGLTPGQKAYVLVAAIVVPRLAAAGRGRRGKR